jgi:hypothetical protein
LRKLHDQVDAVLSDSEHGVELQFRVNGVATNARRFEDRDAALAAAAEKRLELERGGWMAHW